MVSFWKDLARHLGLIPPPYPAEQDRKSVLFDSYDKTKANAVSKEAMAEVRAIRAAKTGASLTPEEVEFYSKWMEECLADPNAAPAIRAIQAFTENIRKLHEDRAASHQKG